MLGVLIKVSKNLAKALGDTRRAGSWRDALGVRRMRPSRVHPAPTLTDCNVICIVGRACAGLPDRGRSLRGW